MKQKRVLSLLLAFALLIGLLPGMTPGVSAADEHAITVLDSAPTTQEVAQGALYKLYMDEVFSDSEGHTMTYELLAGSNGKMTKMAKDEDGKDYLAFTDPGLDADTFNLRITATCSEGATKTYALKITLTKAAGGDENQYGYDESPAASVKVYLTISSDGVPLLGNDGTPLVHKEVNVPYFDLESQGLSDYYRYHTEDGQGAYTDNTIVERPTALHLYLYAIGVYYLGLDPEDVTKGRVEINGHDGNVGVMNMDGEVPYEDEKLALNITGSATSLYMQQFWGHDENLMYYRNHVYPLMSAGWGSTADYILLSDGDTIDVAMFTDWSFWNDGGAFTAFDKDEYTVKKGDTLTVKTVKYDTKSVADGGTEEFDPISENLYLKLYKLNEDGSMEPVVEGIDKAEGGEDNEFLVDTSKLDPDVYYLLARDERTGEDARYAPATALVTVTDGGTTACTHETTEEAYVVHSPADGKFDKINKCTACGEQVGEALGTYLYGDVNGDGTLTSADAKLITGGTTEFTALQKFAADVNADGTVDVVDAIVIRNVYLNKIAVALPAKTTVTYTPNSTTTPTHNINVVVEGAEGECDALKENCSGSDKCDKCGADLTNCEHTKKTYTFTGHTPKDGKFDEVVTCNTCGKQVGETTVHLYGDADDNGAVNALDVAYLMQTASGVEATEAQKAASDVNGDGKLDSVDAAIVKVVVNGGLAQTELPVETDVSYETMDERDDNGDHQHTVVVKLKGASDTLTSFAEVCVDADSDNICDKCGASIKCAHANTETTFKKHDTADGKFDEIVKCKDCLETISETEHYYGDADGNGQLVVGGDFQYLNLMLKQGKELPTEWQKFAADVNEDGQIDDDDIALISAIGRNANIVLPGRTQRAYVYYKLDKGVEKHYKTVTLPDYPDADLGGMYKLNEACTDENGDGRCDLCLHCTHATTEVKDAKAASCTEKGYTGDTYCTVCGEKTADGEEIAMLEHADTDGDGKCDTCGKQLTTPVPTRKEGYPAETSDVVQTGMAYLLSDLQNGKIFQPVEGQTLNYKNYYYQRSTDGGETWGPMTDFSEALFGMTTIQITELEEGTYMYRFYASHDGENFSTDTWTLTLTVSDVPVMNFSFYVGKDYNGGYPIIKLYNVETDDDGNEIMGEEITDAFRYSDFTTTLPEGTAEYDPAKGTLVSNYQMFYATLPSGRYMYRAFMKNADTEAYDVALGGMTLTLPTDTNVDGLTGGGTNIYLQCNSFYTSSKKTDNTFFKADEYHVRVDCPIMKCSTVMGDTYVKGNYTYYPTMLYAAGNACLYNSYFYPDIDGYIFTQNINLTFQASYTAGTKSGNINTGVGLTVTVPADATFGLYFQWNNFNTTEVAPDGLADAAYADRWKDNGDGTKTATYFISKGNGNYTWRLSDDTHVTKSGWLNQTSNSAAVTFTFDANAPTNKLSHDFSKLGNTTKTRDEADIQVNLDPSGFKTLDGKTRVRAYRHWQLINSDAGNIMVEPDFEWHIINGLGGDAEIETVNGGNTTANWADITPGTEDSFIAVHYYSVDTGTINPFNGKIVAGSHGGLYPATNPERVGVIVVGGTGTSHGKADADVDFNIPAGATTTRSMDWDYNYDTWFYNDADPEMTFTVKNANGDVDVRFAMVGFADDLEPEVQQWDAAPVDNDGVYHLPVNEIFGKLGNKRGGTVIIRMEDNDGVSYRLVRASRVDITATNVSHAGEPIMPGDQVKLSFKGMYRSVNKISGVFNPTTFKPTYYDENGTKFEGTLGQYQKMDNSTVTVTIPEDLTFEEGAETATCYFGKGYTFGSMYSAANPFAFLYNMTDAGVGTNFNAVTVTYYLHHYAKAAVTVSPKALYTVKLNATDENGTTLTGVTANIIDQNKKSYTADEDGLFSLGYGTYSYELTKDGYARAVGKFSLGSADAEKVVDGILTINTAVLEKAGEGAWDGTTKTEPKTDEDGTYLIGTGAELAWFAEKVNGGDKTISAKLTADIELTSNAWTPIGSNSVKYGGTFDGNGHVIKHLYINSEATYQGLFGYLSGSAKISNLGVTGIVTTTKNFAAGIAGFMENSATIDRCFSNVRVTANQSVSGIANGQSEFAKITNCYNLGDITATGTNGLAGGITSGNSTSYSAGLTNCYNVGTVSAAKAFGAVTSMTSSMAEVYNCFYLETSCTTDKYAAKKTADELKALAATLGEAFTADTENINGGYPILTWQTTVTPPAGVLGDVNGDGEVNIIDAGLVYAHVGGRVTLTGDALKLADVNGDGEVNIIDAGLVYAYVGGRINEFPTKQ